jgi:hypothetical protein
MSSEIEIAKAIVKAAMKGATEDHTNEVEDIAWLTIESQKTPEERIKAIRFACDTGVVSLEYKFLTTANRDFARLLWNEFADEIVDPDIAATPEGKVTDEAIAEWARQNAKSFTKWKHELVDTPRAKKPEAKAWHDKRLKRANLPIKVASVQLGEIFGGKIEWDAEIYHDVDLEWGPGANGLVGLCTDLGDCYQGWDDERKVYLGYDDEFESNEHVMRLAL